MDGKNLILHASRKLAHAARATVERAALALAEVDWIVPHQANLHLITALERAGAGGTRGKEHREGRQHVGGLDPHRPVGGHGVGPDSPGTPHPADWVRERIHLGGCLFEY
jgi:hypothetical protein